MAAHRGLLEQGLRLPSEGATLFTSTLSSVTSNQGVRQKRGGCTHFKGEETKTQRQNMLAQSERQSQD